MKYFIVALSFALFFALFSASQVFAGTKPSQKVAEGSFIKAGMGDYMHLYIKDKTGKQLHFVCADLPSSMVKGIDCNDLIYKAADYKDKVLVVTYHEENNHIPEAGEKILWNHVDRIDLKK